MSQYTDDALRSLLVALQRLAEEATMLIKLEREKRETSK